MPFSNASEFVADQPTKRVVHHSCSICEACCGLQITVEGDRVTGIRGDSEDPLSRLGSP